MTRNSETASQNLHKYLKPPSTELISAFISELGISDNQFERYYKIPTNTMSHIRSGRRNLAPEYWAIVYEKIIPTYGINTAKYATDSRVTPSVTNRIPKKNLKSPHLKELL